MRRLLTTLSLVAGLLIAPAAARATALDLQIIVSGLNLVYDGTDIYDATSLGGGIGDPSMADALDTMVFQVGGTTVGILTGFTDDIFADVFIADVPALPAGGGTVVSGGNGDGFGFDLLTSLAGFGLALNLDTVEITFEDGSVSILGAGTASSVGSQALPFGLVLDENQPVVISFSGNAFDITESNGLITGFASSGSGEVSGQLVPEPGTLMLGLAGLVGLAVAGTRRR